MNGADAVISTLADNGVRACFANPGTSEMQFVAALDREPRVRPVLCLFEGVVTGAADGYGRMTGHPAATLLHLGPGYAWNSGNAGDNEWSLGLTLELPILDQNQGPIAEAEARRKLAAAKFVELQSQVIGEIDRAVAGWRVARAQLQTGNELLASEQQRQKSAQAQIEVGAADRLDSLNAQLELSNATLAQLDNEAKLQTAFSALEDALQRPADSIAAVIKKISIENSNHSFP